MYAMGATPTAGIHFFAWKFGPLHFWEFKGDI